MSHTIDHDQLLAAIRASVAPILTHRSALRSHLQRSNRLLPFANRDPHQDPAAESLAAIDGSRVQEHLYLLDLVVAKACAANGKISPRHPLPNPATWAHVLTRDPSTYQVAATAMAALETRQLAEADHHVRILDGNFLTPLMGLREGLHGRKPDARAAAVALLRGPIDPINALNQLYTPNYDRPILAVTKGDTSRVHAHTFTSEGFPVGSVPDRTLASQLLKPGEFLAPVDVDYRFAALDRPVEGDAQVRSAAADLRATADQLIAHTDAHHIHTVFFKPYGSHHTVIKFEYFHPTPDPQVARRYVEIVNQDTRAPHILEPYAQWRVDADAKTINREPDNILQLVMARMTPEERATLGPLLLTKYRT